MTLDYKTNTLINTARTTGFWYLLLAISGIVGFLVFHSQVFVSNDPQKTLTNLMEKESLARTRLLLEFVILVSQALTAVWFYKLFKAICGWTAWTLSIWGTVNSVIILISAISMASAIGAADSSVVTVEEKILLVHVFQNIITSAWGIGGLFFGLWLFPMGYIIITSKRMPVWLGRILILGGVGYLISTVISYAGLNFPYHQVLTFPATIGEFWMIGYLLIFGIRPDKTV